MNLAKSYIRNEQYLVNKIYVYVCVECINSAILGQFYTPKELKWNLIAITLQYSIIV